MTVKEAATHLGVSTQYIYKMIYRGDLKTLPNTPQYIITEESLQSYNKNRKPRGRRRSKEIGGKENE